MSLAIVLPPSTAPSAAAAVARAVAHATRAEAAGVAFVVVTGAAVPRLWPVLVAAHLGALTTRVGIVAAAPADGAEPFHLSTALATLDHNSHGRAGWLVERADDLADAAAVVDAVARLWDSWEDDAVIRDVASGRYLDRTRLHAVNVESAKFRIAGPSITPRPPQGRLPIIADAALAGTQPATRWVELVLGEQLVEFDVRDAGDAARVQDAIADGGAALARPVTDDAFALLTAARTRPGGFETLRGRLGLARPRSVYARTG